MKASAGASPSRQPDGLAQSIDFGARRGAGAGRAVVLGGGGLVAIAWQLAYVDALARHGVDLAEAEIIVGTSAGSVVGCLLASRKQGAGVRKLAWLGRLPWAAGAVAGAREMHPSQRRGLDLFRYSTDGDPETVREIGFAALAARTPAAGHLRRAFFAITPTRQWPKPGLRIVSADAFTGERLVLSAASEGLSVTRAMAASASVPGLFTPQRINDRRCIDGGVTGSATHADLVAGAKRVIVLSLGDAVPPPGLYCQRPGSLREELEKLSGSGSVVKMRIPGFDDLAPESLMDPARIPAAFALARRQAARDADDLGSFWSL